MNFDTRRDETTATGFEPVQVKPNCLAGNRLNHSAKLSRDEFQFRYQNLYLCMTPRPGIEPGATA